MLSWVPQQASTSIFNLPSDKASWASLSAFSFQPFPLNGSRRRLGARKNHQGIMPNCVLAKVKNPPSPTPETLIKESHKYFDEVIITVRAGDGGHGAILSLPNQKAPSKSQGKLEKEKARRKSLYKRDFDGSVILPMGGHGGDIVIYADESKDTLLEFHKKSRYSAKRGGNVDAMGVLSSQLHNGLAGPSLRIPVPLVGSLAVKLDGIMALLSDLAGDREVGDDGSDSPLGLTHHLHVIGGSAGFSTVGEEVAVPSASDVMAATKRVTLPVLIDPIRKAGYSGTVVKRKRGKLLADLARPGDEVVVARGGQGGVSLLKMPEHKRDKLVSLTTNVMRDENDKVLTFGQSGEEVGLQLILRVVADVGLVPPYKLTVPCCYRGGPITARREQFATPSIGLPNAGKSTLLAAITLAKPDIADYPFTTLMPNLGRLNGDPSLGPEQFSSEATLADLPGLIQGAHLGKGLGRNFLRHLRRTRMLVHVVDASMDDPVRDYMTVKEELRMYNPDYLERPYIVVLNKIDVPKAKENLPYITEEIWRIGSDKQDGQTGTITSEIADIPLASDEDQANAILHEKKVKEIEEYPRPFAVVAASVLKGIRVDEMLKEIRAALRSCRDGIGSHENSVST
ncbi:hypothetical protein OROGR_032832 [Orobanche gracilis]